METLITRARDFRLKETVEAVHADFLRTSSPDTAAMAATKQTLANLTNAIAALRS